MRHVEEKGRGLFILDIPGDRRLDHDHSVRTLCPSLVHLRSSHRCKQASIEFVEEEDKVDSDLEVYTEGLDYSW
jgi:hypothetical protein